ncbi:MAG: hypothetical protein HFG93_00570 [Dorea sp.]|jgi:hypothetical protein|nr:hypothetical protein [Dorea sp.]
MKSKLAKASAAALAVTMCSPVSALAAETSGSFDTSFDIYSPALTIQVPVKADIQVNPFSDSTATDVKKFSVASNSIDIWNASVDADKDIGIPVNATVRATITAQADDVITEYNTFSEDATSSNKRINLNLSTAGTAATIKAKAGETLAFTADKKLNFAQFETNAAADYSTPADSVAITKYGSLLSVDIGAPTTTDTTAGATFTTNVANVTAAVGSFAVTGVANSNADWKADDVAVAITYDVRASKPRNITTPKIATAPVFTSGTSAADLKITVPSIGEATVTAIAAHNDAGEYKDYIWESDAYSVDYTTTAGSAVITIPKDDGGLAYLAGDAYKGKKQDFEIALSDGRMVVTTLTVN